MTLGEQHRDGRELAAILRNTVYEESLRTIMSQRGGERLARPVVPRSIESDLETVLARIGTPEVGVERSADRRLYVEPGVYIENVLPVVLASINAVMDATPVEAFPGAVYGALLTGPPDDSNGIFGPASRERVRLLGGIPTLVSEPWAVEIRDRGGIQAVRPSWQGSPPSRPVSWSSRALVHLRYTSRRCSGQRIARCARGRRRSSVHPPDETLRPGCGPGGLGVRPRFEGRHVRPAARRMIAIRTGLTAGPRVVPATPSFYADVDGRSSA